MSRAKQIQRKRNASAPIDFDARYAVRVIYDPETRIGRLDHSVAVEAWDAYNRKHPLTTKETTDV